MICHLKWPFHNIFQGGIKLLTGFVIDLSGYNRLVHKASLVSIRLTAATWCDVGDKLQTVSVITQSERKTMVTVRKTPTLVG